MTDSVVKPGSNNAPLGLLGGTFDPIHHGHLRLAEEAWDGLGLDSVLLIPAGSPPHRNTPRTSAEHRLAMVQLAAEANDHLKVDAAEVRAEGPSYTVLSLERLRALHGPDQPLVLLVGADAFLGLATWHRWKDIFTLAHIAVATRPSHVLEVEHMAPALAEEFQQRLHRGASALQEAPAGYIVPFGITPLDISATAIRAALSTGRSPRYLLPEAVVDYIGRHQLYTSAPVF